MENASVIVGFDGKIFDIGGAKELDEKYSGAKF